MHLKISVISILLKGIHQTVFVDKNFNVYKSHKNRISQKIDFLRKNGSRGLKHTARASLLKTEN
jgi:hypothetical protein